MYYNYLITAIRNFRKNKFYLFVNILGLSIGITCCLVVYTILKHEMTFDHFHKNADRIYRVVEHYQGENGVRYNGVLPNAMPNGLNQSKSRIQEVITMHGPISASIEFYHNRSRKIFVEDENILFANSSFLRNLDFSIIHGSPASVLDEPFKVYLTEKIAFKYFGDQNPIGQFITFDENYDLEVVGILEDTPSNTNIYFEMLISYPTILEWNGDYIRSWNSYWAGSSYVVANARDNIKDLEKEITEIAFQHISERSKERTSYHLQPLAKIHTDTKYDDGVRYVAPTEILMGFVLLALITLVASILNFINLATAQAVQRSKEVGIRKTLGSSRSGLIFQFIGETLIISLVSTLLAFTIGQVFIDQMNNFLTIVSLDIAYDLSTLVFALLLCIVVSLLAGFYPSVILSSYNPIAALNNRISLHKGSGKMSLRKGLVLAQFVIANFLIISTIIVASQMRFIKTKDLGFDRSNVVVIDFPDRLKDQIPLVRNALDGLSFVEHSSQCMSTPQSQSNWNTSYHIQGKSTNEQMAANVKFIDEKYLELYKIPILDGRNLQNQYFSDTTFQIVVNEEFVRRGNLPLDSAVGRNIRFMGGWKGKISAVVGDFHASGLQNGIRPVMMLYNPNYMAQINLKLSSNEMVAYLPEIEQVYRQFADNDIFMSSFLSDIIAQNYIMEELVFNIFQIFAGMAILIGIFGLYGLVSFMAARNRKSISIRKVFGAGIPHILGMFSREYVILIIISFVMAAPVGWYLSEEWLNGFEYRIPVTPVYFLIAIIVSMIITFSTVGYRSYKAATSNPVDSLRYE